MTKATFEPLDNLIEEKGLRYNFVAKKMGIDPSYLWQMRCNLLKMDINHMELLAEILGVDFFDIYELRKKFAQNVSKNATKNSNDVKQPA
ncbi:helix-turn-helix domain-containing protein [Enterococcus hirae]|uniref:helix-turn-helix domain-containing protein n=1 Tax=Enterococcus hirae TaxID=1354 RepID=UPI001A07B6A2|nr:helix-turn-helix transcriptional regulator [Enterococcus hirae]EMF0406398.1 helix-turn-helix transcriptional regulator [Enterococcus hirae]